MFELMAVAFPGHMWRPLVVCNFQGIMKISQAKLLFCAFLRSIFWCFVK